MVSGDDSMGRADETEAFSRGTGLASKSKAAKPFALIVWCCIVSFLR